MTIERALEALRGECDRDCAIRISPCEHVVAIEELTKPCETCGGEGEMPYGGGEAHKEVIPCSNDCVDGRLPIGESE